MVAISITAPAYEALGAMMPADRAAAPGPDGLIRIWLDGKFVDRLGQMRGRGEAYSDVILRLTKPDQ
jgi:hypothetical protein